MLQVMRTASEYAMKSKVCVTKTIQAIQGKNLTCLLPLALLLMLCTRNNTDGNKLVIFIFHTIDAFTIEV